MTALFTIVLTLLILLAPFVFRVDGDFCLQKKTAFVAVRFFRVRVFSLLLYFSDDGVYYSIYGKKGKKFGSERRKKKKKTIKLPFSLDSIRFADISVKIYLGGDAETLAYSCGAAATLTGEILDFLEKRKLLDKGKILVLPCFSSNQTTVNFSICFFTSIVKLLSSIVHTNDGENYAKRRYRKYHG
ncbi:MAG: hypothetical protein K5753_00435 [Clostridia bacterium]|nr:hypothetical protein [Clostridia bacterium]